MRCRLQRRPSSAGFTILELMISVTLMVVVLQIVASAALAMERSGRFGRKRTQVLAKNQHVLQKIANELRTSSMDSDPVTNQPYATLAGGDGEGQITFQRVVQFGDAGGELIPVWSTPIQYRRVGDQLVRTQDGVDTIVMRGVVWLGFEIDALGRFGIELGNSANPDDTQATVVMQEIRVSPML